MIEHQHGTVIDGQYPTQPHEVGVLDPSEHERLPPEPFASRG